jgi:hypothetical protein
MDKDAFQKAEPMIARAAELAENLLDSADLEELGSLLTELNKVLGSRYEVALEVNVQLFDRKKPRSLPLVQVGVEGYGQDDPYRTKSASTFQKYIAEGEIEAVPYDRCPKCWQVWDFKFREPSCPHCGATMGKNVRLLLDSDVCPECGEGTVSMSSPVCDKCGYRADPQIVTWG